MVEVVPSWRKDFRSAPRAGIAMLMRPGLQYYVRQIRNERKERSNGLFEVIEVERKRGTRISVA